ncbi:MAG: esterase/lipase family protein [Gemmatimonadales bacterium]
MLAQDAELGGLDVYLTSFASPYLAHAMTLEEVTSNLYRRLWDDKVFTRYTEIYFVAHSMGGLIAEGILQNLNTPGNAPILRRVHAVITLSTPGNGASTAELGDFISANPQLEDMQPATLNSWIQQLQNDMQDLRSERDSMDVWFPRFFAAYETRPTQGIPIVSRVYAVGLPLDSRLVPVNTDHIGIAKPDDPRADIYKWVKARILQAMQPPPRPRVLASAEPPLGGGAGPLADRPSSTPAPAPREAGPGANAITTITVQLWTDTDDKDSEEAILCSIRRKGKAVATGGPWGQGEVWGDQEDRQGGRPHIFDMPVREPLQTADLRDLEVEIRKTDAGGNGGKGWDFRLTVFAKLADGTSVRILGETPTIRLGDGQPPVFTAALN